MKSNIILFLALALGYYSLVRLNAWTKNQITISTMKEQYGATPCSDKLLIEKFNQMLKDYQIANKISLFEANAIPNSLGCNTAAFYAPNHQTVTIIRSAFVKFSPVVQDFLLHHELRHHFQFTTNTARQDVQKIEKELNMSTSQAQEYDADTKALEIMATKNCPHCMREIRDVRTVAFFKHHEDKGYVTTKAVNHFVKQTKKNATICDYHKKMSSSDLLFKTVTSAARCVSF